MKTKEHLIEWLKDAHAMEMQAVEILEKQAERLKHYPEMQSRIRRHVDETKKQAERLNNCIERIDGGVSSFEDITGKVTGNFTAIMNSMADDEVIKTAIADYSFEHFEIASYKSLIEAAQELGEEEIVQVCRTNLREEQDMALWVEQTLPKVTRIYLEYDERGHKASR